MTRAALLLLVAACSSTQPAPAGPSDASTTPPEEDAETPDAGQPEEKVTTVTGFDKTHVFFTGSENKRVVDTTADFPETGTYKKAVLELALDCPNSKCDHWDRFGTLGVVTEKAVDGGSDTVVEIGRYMTPYRVGGKWQIDVTDLRPLLKGKVTLRAFIDTWVGPGSPYGNGWLVSTTFKLTEGKPEREAIAVVPIVTMRSLVYGDPARPIAQSKTIDVPAASSYAVRSFITGHGQGNHLNCAEFCSKRHAVSVDGVKKESVIWRSDCRETAVQNQAGTWQYPRAGWCPGADVRPWTVDVDLKGKTTATVGYDVEAYENSCRPGVQTCTGCTLGTGCDYDGGNHTEPIYYVSTLLIAYR